MSERAKWAKIGAGNVNSALGVQIAERSAALRLEPLPAYVVRRGGTIYSSDGKTLLPGAKLMDMPRVNIAFIGTPTDPAVEIPFLNHYLGKKVPVVMCAKGALSERYGEVQALSDGGRLLGDSATVGGGTGLVDHLGRYIRRPDVNEVHVTPNGTLAAIMSSPKPLDEATQDAIAEGLAEPGSTSPLAVVRAELDDVSRKAAIIINKLFSGEPIDWRPLRMVLNDDQIEQALDERRRLMVSMYPMGSEGYTLEHGVDEVIEGFDVWHNDWRFIGGFSKIGRNEVRNALERTSGPDIGFSVGLGVDNRNGIYSLTGPGAGPYPTSSMMLGDWTRLNPNDNHENPSSTHKKRFIRTTSISLDSIKTGEGYDEKALDENSFYAVNNWRTGWEPIFSMVTAKNQMNGSSVMDEIFAKARELEKAGYKVRFTPHSVTVGKDKLNIRHSDDSFDGATVWVVRDQELHEQYDGQKSIDNWWGLHIRKDHLPQLAYDGEEQELAEALLPHASLFVHEMDSAFTKEMAERDQRPTIADFESVQAFRDWRAKNPEPTRQVDAMWDRQLDIQFTNNLYYLFTTNRDGEPSFDTPLSRQYLSRLENEAPRFVAAARVASQKYANLLSYELALARKGVDLLPNERLESQVRSWICAMYSTEAQTRFRDLGATDEEIRHLRN